MKVSTYLRRNSYHMTRIHPLSMSTWSYCRLLFGIYELNIHSWLQHFHSIAITATKMCYFEEKNTLCRGEQLTKHYKIRSLMETEFLSKICISKVILLITKAIQNNHIRKQKCFLWRLKEFDYKSWIWSKATCICPTKCTTVLSMNN